MKFDVAVIGLGAMGSAAAYHLARRGLHVLGIERATPGHDLASSHGTSRIIRIGYFEHPSYVPLLRETYRLWAELEAVSGRELLHKTGIIEMGRPDSTLVAGTLDASRRHSLPHEVLDARETMRRFPAYRLPDDFIGVYQPDGGFLAADAAIETHLKLAKEAGAQLHQGETVLAIEPRGDGVRIRTADGAIDVGRVIVSAGAWIKTLLPSLPAPVWATRQVLAWFEPLDRSLFQEDKFPVFLLESRHGIHYGFPHRLEGREIGLKIAKHHHADERVDPDACNRDVTADDEALIRSAIAEHIPAANGPMRAAKTCLYTMTPDGDFVLDQMPGAPQIVIASPCSGHGFKFAPVIGEILADLAIKGETAHDIARFRLARFG